MVVVGLVAVVAVMRGLLVKWYLRCMNAG
jgi:hypothetical protein